MKFIYVTWLYVINIFLDSLILLHSNKFMDKIEA